MVKRHYPVDCSLIQDFVMMEKIWSYITEEVDVEAEECVFLLSETLWNPREKRQRTMEIFFEKFNASGNND